MRRRDVSMRRRDVSMRRREDLKRISGFHGDLMMTPLSSLIK